MPIGLPELGIILLIILVIFGPKRLPGLGKQLGTGMREFKDSITGKDGGEDEDAPAADAPQLAPATAAAPVPPPTVAAPPEPAAQPEDRPAAGA